MAYVKTTWRPRGDPLGETTFTSTRMNNIEQGIADAHAGIRKAPSCRLAHTGNWTGGDTGGFVNLAGGWNVEVWDNDNMHDAAVNPDRITFRTAGIYVVAFSANMDSGAGERFGCIRANLAGQTGGELEIDRDQKAAFANDVVAVKCVTPLIAAVNDYCYVQLGSYQKGSAWNAGANLGTGNYGEPWFAAWKIGDLA
jgi:hypothetical protein